MSEFRKKDTFEIIVGGQTIKVEYDGISYGVVLHFSFYGKYISSTGYRSHFLFVDDYIWMKYTDYKICALEIADKLYEDFKKERIKNGIVIEQLEFFRE